jgi:chromosome segregation ATPase
MSEEKLNELANELIQVKKEISSLLEKEKRIKEEIKPLLKAIKSINLEHGRVYFYVTKGNKTFNRKEVLIYLKEAYGDAFADQVDKDCTKCGEPHEVISVKMNKE